MSYGIAMLLWVGAALFSPGCHFFEDSENVNECPLNSGYPCPCIPDMAQYDCKGLSDYYCCKDGRSSCVYTDTPESRNRGICTKPCNGIDDSLSCRNTQDYGSEGICAMAVGSSDAPNFCEVICTPGVDDCPPGMECRDDIYLYFSVCRPEPETLSVAKSTP